MAEDQPIYIFPRASGTDLLIAAGIFVALFFLAIFLELWRRRRDRRLRLSAEWRAVEQLMHEREFSEEEKTLLRDFLKRNAPQQPFVTTTIRHSFDACVDEELGNIERRGDEAALERQGVLLRDIRVRLGLDYIPFGQRIQSTRDLFRGQLVWISRDNGAKKSWQSTTLAHVDEVNFSLAPKEGPMNFSAGDVLRCRLWREEDARYLFEIPVHRVSHDPPLLILRHTTQLDRTQSRAHFRIRHDEAVDVNVLSATVSGDDSDIEHRPVVTRLRGRLTSLSAGGLAVVLPQPLPKLVYLRIELRLYADSAPITTYSRLVDTVEIGGGRYLMRSSFVRMEEDVRDAITHFVFRQQTQQSAQAQTPLV